MPEGPSIVILREELKPFTGKKVIKVSGNSKEDIARIQGQKIIAFKSWGKHLLICFKGFTVRIHLLLFGKYRINDTIAAKPRLSLKLTKDEINFYNCSVKIIDGDLNKVYDWEVDTMSKEWSVNKVKKLVKAKESALVCDVLLDQDIFAGSGNIVKNEVLFRMKLHPLNKISRLPAKKINELVKDVPAYCHLFYEWKKKFELKKHWQVYRCKTCPRCKIPLQVKYLGHNRRKTFFCTNCQLLYKAQKKGK